MYVNPPVLTLLNTREIPITTSQSGNASGCSLFSCVSLHVATMYSAALLWAKSLLLLCFCVTCSCFLLPCRSIMFSRSSLLRQALHLRQFLPSETSSTLPPTTVFTATFRHRNVHTSGESTCTSQLYWQWLMHVHVHICVYVYGRWIIRYINVRVLAEFSSQ